MVEAPDSRFYTVFGVCSQWPLASYLVYRSTTDRAYVTTNARMKTLGLGIFAAPPCSLRVPRRGAASASRSGDPRGRDQLAKPLVDDVLV